MKNMEVKVIVTGGAGYIGRTVCEQFVQQGATVTSIDLHDSSLRSEIVGNAAERYTHSICDLAERIKAHAVIDQAAKEMGGIDILVCATGLMSPDDGGTLNIDAPHWATSFSANLHAVANSIDAALGYLRKSSWPSVVVVGSLVSSLGSVSAEFAYTSSKGAVASLVRELAVVYATEGIRINIVAPGPLVSGLFATPPDSSEEQRVKRIPLRRRGTADEVASAIRFLASSDASYITGISLAVDGGASAAFLTNIE